MTYVLEMLFYTVLLCYHAIFCTDHCVCCAVYVPCAARCVKCAFLPFVATVVYVLDCFCVYAVHVATVYLLAYYCTVVILLCDMCKCILLTSTAVR